MSDNVERYDYENVATLHGKEWVEKYNLGFVIKVMKDNGYERFFEAMETICDHLEDVMEKKYVYQESVRDQLWEDWFDTIFKYYENIDEEFKEFMHTMPNNDVLRQRCKENGIKRYSKMNKQQLVEVLNSIKK